MQIKSVYDIFDDAKKRPALYLGNNIGVTSLDLLIRGFRLANGKFIDEKKLYPNFNLFTSWLGGMIDYPYQGSSFGWCWLLLDKYKDEKISLEKFFEYLDIFKLAKYKIEIAEIKEFNTEYSINNNFCEVWCQTGYTRVVDGNQDKAYMNLYNENVKKIDKIVVFSLTPSKTQFPILLDKNEKVLELRNTDMTGKIKNKIMRQFHLDNKDFNYIEGDEYLKTVEKIKNWC